MSRSLGKELPDTLRDALLNTVPSDIAVLLITSSGFPHVSMLSWGELFLANAGTLRLALWPGSTATKNLTGNSSAALTAVLGGSNYTVAFSARRRADLDLPGAGKLACFDGHVEDVREDTVGYAVITSGIRFTLNDPESVARKWQEKRAALSTMGDANNDGWTTY